MGTAFLVALAIAGVGGGDVPDGRLVLSVAGHDPGSDTVTREWAAVADPRTGELHKRRLPGGTLCAGRVLAVGDRVVYTGARRRRAVALALPPSLRGPARSLGAADTLTPLHSAESIWLGRWLGNSRIGLRQVDARGHTQVLAAIHGWRWSQVYAALDRGFAISARDALMVWDPGVGKSLLRVRHGWFLGASGTRVTWCDGNCPSAHLWSRGGRARVNLPAHARPLGTPGVFSPDGRTLALGVTVRGRARVALVDARTGASRLVPGGELGGYDAIAWSRSGRWLYFTAGDEELRAWTPGAAAATRLPVDPRGTVMSIDVAP